MDFLEKMTIKARLTVLVGFMAVLMVIVGVMGLCVASNSNQGLRTAYLDRMIPLGQLSAIENYMVLNRLHITKVLEESTPEQIQASLEGVAYNRAEIDRLWKEYIATYLTPDEKKLAAKFTSDRERFIKDGIEPVVTFLRAGNVEAARNIARQSFERLYAPAKESIAALKKRSLMSPRRSSIRPSAAMS